MNEYSKTLLDLIRENPDLPKCGECERYVPSSTKQYQAVPSRDWAQLSDAELTEMAKRKNRKGNATSPALRAQRELWERLHYEEAERRDYAEQYLAEMAEQYLAEMEDESS